MAKRSTGRKAASAGPPPGQKTAAVRISHHLQKPLESLLKEARALRGQVVEQSELSALISSLETLQTRAASNCPKIWSREFTLNPAGTARKR